MERVTPVRRATSSSRHPTVDLLKVSASVVIVLHHLAFYGPMSDHVAKAYPEFVDGLAEYGRWAVQIFLVLGGFLAAQRLLPSTALCATWRGGAREIVRRLRRLMPAYLIVLGLAVVCNALVSTVMHHPSVPSAPTWAQMLAHLFLLETILGFESVSAGLWYVAIDIQLYVLLVAWLCTVHQWRDNARAHRRWATWGVVIMVVASLLWWNRTPDLDPYALYFVASYGLGVLCGWRDARRSPWAPLLVVALAWGLGWLVEPRERLLVAAATGLFLLLPGWSWAQTGWGHQLRSWLHRAGDASYAVFLVHFPICLIVNAVFELGFSHTPGIQGVGMLVALFASLAAGWLFHTRVERPLQRNMLGTRAAPQE